MRKITTTTIVAAALLLGACSGSSGETEPTDPPWVAEARQEGLDGYESLDVEDRGALCYMLATDAGATAELAIEVSRGRTQWGMEYLGALAEECHDEFDLSYPQYGVEG